MAFALIIPVWSVFMGKKDKDLLKVMFHTCNRRAKRSKTCLFLPGCKDINEILK